MKVINKIPRIIRAVILIAALVAIAGFVSMGFIAKASGPTNPPSVSEAPWAIQTSTRIYYAKEFRLNEKTPEIRNYWTFDGKHYEYVEGEKSFDKQSWGNVAVVRRSK